MLALFGGKKFHPRRLFLSDAVKGAIYDFDSFDYLYQKADGSVPVTALEQPVGLVVDKRYGGLSALGANVVTNGGFDADANWTKGTGWTISGGVASKSAGTGSAITQDINAVAGRAYLVTIDVTRSAGFAYLRIGSTTDNTVGVSASGSYSRVVFCGSASDLFYFFCDAAFVGTIDNVTVRELPGLHAYQSTDPARPVLSARYNLLLATSTLSTQSVTTLAASYTLTFTGAGTVTLSGTATGVKSAGSNVFMATAGTLTLTVSGDVTLADLRLTADANSRLPAYQRVTSATDYDSVGFPRFLRIDATDDFLQTASVDPGTDKVFVCAGVTKMSDPANAVMLIESSTNQNTTAGTFALRAPNATSLQTYGFYSGGSLPVFKPASGFPAPHTAVLSGIGDIGADLCAIRVNGSDVIPPTTTDQGTGNYTAQPIYIGARAGTSLRLNNGRIYPMVICFKAVTAGEIAATEAWVNSRTRAF